MISETKLLTEIDNDTSSLSIQCCQNNILLFLRTSLLEPSNLLISRFDSNNPGKIKLQAISKLPHVAGFENLKYEAIDHLYDNDDQISK